MNNIIKVTLSNIVTLVAGVLVGLLLPKFISVEGYGYYKIFTLYAPYLALLNLGLIDGIGLKYGDKDYQDLNRKDFRSYFAWYLIIHAFFLAILIPATFLLAKGEYLFIFLALEINLIAVNITGYLQHISQITQRFKEFSNRKIVQAVLNIAIVVILYVVKSVTKLDANYRLYVILLVVSNYILMLWYCSTYKDIVVGTHSSIKSTASDCIQFVKNGFPLVFSYQIASLILSLDRQFVSILFPTTTYATYSFAYSMLALVTTATSAVSAVLFPMLKRMSIDILKLRYEHFISSLIIVVFGLIVIYFPLGLFIHWFLPNYSDSLPIFRVILPGIAISSSITTIMHNYYKVLNINYIYFIKSCIVLVFSGIANWLAYKIFCTTISISVASIVTMFIWFFFIESTIRKRCDHRGYKYIIYIVIMTCGFYIITEIENYYLSMMIYLTVFILISLLLFNDLIKSYFISYKKGKGVKK